MRMNPDEIKLVVFILLALLIGTAVKHYRTSRVPVLPPSPAATAPAAAEPFAKD